MSGELPRDEIKREYSQRLEARRAVVARLERREARVANARLVVFAALPIVAWLAFVAERISGWWLIPPAFLFAFLVWWHERSRRAIHGAARATVFYEKGLARLDDRWAGTGEPGLRFLDTEHPYSADLDLFGAGSLFERLCTARTRSGEDRLASWLLGPAPIDVIVARQAAVEELRPRLDLRESLDLLGDDVRAGVDPDALAKWGRTPRSGIHRLMRAFAVALTVLAIVATLFWAFRSEGGTLFLIVLTAEIVFVLATRRRVAETFAGLELRTHDLVLLASLLETLERESFQAEALTSVRSALQTEGIPASQAIAHLGRLVQQLSMMKNQFFAPFGFVVLWPFHFAIAIDRWRARFGPAIGGWLLAIGEFESLGALASYAFENPGDSFPELVAEGAWYQAESLGHPLIPLSSCVRNDIALGGETRVALISGSNMSGKSTLLRAVGVNAVLALAGAPVRARKLRLSRLAIGATLRIQDSLQAGRSRFYAEITRIRQVVDLAGGPIPLLFLLDEILHGTNSHDRRIGAESIVRGLIDRGAIGLVTTHDLALTEFADELAPRGLNVHFEDHFENGTMCFDYVMRPGVVRKSNALALMRAVGLDV
ncbi:MAG: DNA mismatch repair protein MutS [Isosphaeraceae bacterium]|nr:DNA mismatch repair protein MutS [Isosphaeraceae bacterium]